MMINGSYQVSRRLQRHVIYTVVEDDFVEGQFNNAALEFIIEAIDGSHEVDLIDYETSTDLALTRRVRHER